MRASLLGLLLAATTAAVYWEVGDFPFVDYDDYVYVVENPQLRSGLDGDAIRRAFTTTYGLRSNWIPLTALSLQLDYTLYGLDASGYHLENLALHIATTLLLLLALTRLTGAFGRSAFVAAVFALHPLHVESVAWVAERKDVLSGLFFALTLCAYERYVRAIEKPRPSQRSAWAWYGLTLLGLVCGLLSKPMLVTLPALLLLLDFWPLQRIGFRGFGRSGAPSGWARALAEKLPMLALVAVASAVTLSVQGAAGAVADAEDWLGLPLRAMNAIDAVRVYLAQAFWPSGLAVFYPHPMALLTTARVLPAAVLLVALTGLVLWLSHRRESAGYWAVGWFWFLGTLVPVIGLVQVGIQGHADRYMYLPLIGLSLMVAWGACDALAWFAGDRRPAKVALAIAALVGLLACAATTRLQVRHWRDQRALFTRAVAVTQGNFFAHNALGDHYLSAGDFDEAQRHYKAAHRLRRIWLAPDQGLADVAAARGELDVAIKRYRRLLTRYPKSPRLLDHYSTAMMRAGRFEKLLARLETFRLEQPERGDVRLILAEVLLRTGQPELAIAHYRALLATEPFHPEAHDLLGLALLQAGRLEQAEQHHASAAQVRPNWVVAQLGLARVEVARGKFDAAIARYRRWLPQAPKRAGPSNELGLGKALIGAGRLGEAAAYYQDAKSRHPGSAEPHLGLARVAIAKGERTRAIRHYQAALAIDADRADAQAELGGQLADRAERGDRAQARIHLERARQLGVRSAALEGKLGMLAQQMGEPAKAIAHFQAALALDERDLAAKNNLAWILATSDRADLRKPRAALFIAGQMVREWPDAGADPLDTLAAAQAAVGHFERAAETAERAVQQAARAGNPKLAQRIRSREQLYRKGRPFVEVSKWPDSRSDPSETPRAKTRSQTDSQTDSKTDSKANSQTD